MMIKKKCVPWLTAAVALLLAVTAGCMLMPLKKAKAETAYNDCFGVYQGYKDWYYLEGDFEANALHRMMLSYEDDGTPYWQGKGWWNRIKASLDQGTDGGYDTVRAYRAPYDGVLSLTGSIKNLCGAGDGVKVSVVRRPAARYTDAAANEVLFTQAFAAGGGDVVDIETVTATQNVAVTAGDVFYFVADGLTTPNNDNVRFEIIPVYAEGAADPTVDPGETVYATPVVYDGDWTPTLVTETDIVPQNSGWTNVLRPAYLTQNAPGQLTYVVAGNTTDGFAVLEKKPDGGDTYRYAHSSGNTNIFWGQQFGANPDNEIGTRFTVPADGTADILGAYICAAGDTVTGWRVMKRTALGYETVWSAQSVKTITDFSSHEALKGIPVEKGDELFVLATSATYWVNVSAMYYIDFSATVPHEKLTKEDAYADNPAIEGVTDADLAKARAAEQGANGWFKLYGSPAEKYAKLSRTDAGWARDGVSLSDDGLVTPSDTYNGLLAYLTPFNGTLSVKGWFTAPSVSSGADVKIYRKTASGLEVLFSKSYLSAFTHYFEIAGEAAGGDTLYFSVGGAAVTVQAYADFTKGQTPGDEATDVGADIPLGLDYTQFYKDENGKTQGAYNWFKVYGDTTDYYLFPKDADGNYMKPDSSGQMSITHTGIVTSSNGESAMPVWRAPFNGKVTFNGKITSGDLHSGLTFGIYKKTSASAAAVTVEETEYTQAFVKVLDERSFEVVSGELYFFALTSKAGEFYSNATFLMNAQFTADAADPGEAAGDYIGEWPDVDYTQFAGASGAAQGTDNWYRLYGNAVGGGYFKMKWNAEQSFWEGGVNGSGLWHNRNLGANGGSDGILMWRAPFNGTVTFNGKFYMDEANAGTLIGDGIKLSLVTRKGADAPATEISSKVYTAAFTQTIRNLSYEVKSGEMYFFSLNQCAGEYKTVYVMLNAAFVKDEADPGEAADDDIGDVPVYTKAQYDSFYSETQGGNDWYFMYGNAAAKYYLMNYNGVKWTGSEPYCGLSVDDQHPGNAEDSIRAYRAPHDGKVTFTGQVSGAYGGNSDGIVFRVYYRHYNGTGYDAARQLGADVVLNKESMSAVINFRNLEATRGDLFFFAVNCNSANANDSTLLHVFADFTVTAEGTPAGDDLGCARIIDSTSYYSSEQGKNGWFYAYGSPEKYSMMEWKMATDGNIKWTGKEDYLSLSIDNQHPGNSYGAMRIWVADQSGTVCIEGSASKLATGGDGVNACIRLNGTALWEHKYGAAAQNENVDLAGVSVAKGDKIFFYVNSGDNGANASDSFLFRTELYWETEGEGRVEGEDLSKFLSPVSYAELIGVNILPEEIIPEARENKGCGGAAAGSAGGAAVVLLAAAGLVAAAKKRRMAE